MIAAQKENEVAVEMVSVVGKKRRRITCIEVNRLAVEAQAEPGVARINGHHE